MAAIIAVDAIAGHNSSALLTSLSIVTKPAGLIAGVRVREVGMTIERLVRGTLCPTCPIGSDDVPRANSLVVEAGIVATVTENQNPFARLRDAQD
ncbi:hypothetical protein [Neorhodopirellula lusitana]|uniref:hypothetical protein n=1 Tax=Neorhodopirellula lusitana TaxID=445327 RepID=UPI0024B6F06C|nr:hypothetical protein [Neorhodopirellula lusitana]